MDSRFREAWAQLNFEEGELLNTRRPLMFMDAHAAYKSGVPGTALEQAKTFLSLIKHFTEESQTFRDLIVDIVENCKNNEIIIYCGKYSVACFDSAAGWEADVEDYLAIPEKPQKCPKTGHMYGNLRGEMIIHLLEERLYMKKPGSNFTRSHMRCLSKGSYQNRYRLEMGCSFEALSFDFQQHTFRNTVHEQGDWEGVDANGYKMVVQNINSGKMLNRFHRGATCNYKPSPEQIKFTQINLSDFIDQKIKGYYDFCTTAFQKHQKANEEDIIGLDFWLSWKATTKEEYDQLKLTVIGPFTISVARKKTWNVLRVALRNRMYEEADFVSLGITTFGQNFKGPIPNRWNTIEYPFEDEITTFKQAIKKNMVTLHGQQESEADRIIASASLHF